MSASRLVTIWCDECGTWEFTGHDAAEARRYAKAAGWRVNLPADEHGWRRRDLCSACASEMSQPPGKVGDQ